MARSAFKTLQSARSIPNHGQPTPLPSLSTDSRGGAYEYCAFQEHVRWFCRHLGP